MVERNASAEGSGRTVATLPRTPSGRDRAAAGDKQPEFAIDRAEQLGERHGALAEWELHGGAGRRAHVRAQANLGGIAGQRRVGRAAVRELDGVFVREVCGDIEVECRRARQTTQ